MQLKTAWRQLPRLFAHAPRRPRIHVYTIGWNEERLLSFFFRHYDQWVDRYVIYDDNSTDATQEMLHAHPRVEARPLVRSVPDSFVLSAQAIHDSCWKESRGEADWVIITDIDEHLYHPELAVYLMACKRSGVTAIPGLGYNMISDSFPQGEQRLCELVRRGEPAVSMSKFSLFDPNSLTETNYAVGRHTADPKGNVRYPKEDRLLNLHFKTLGLDYVIARYRLLATKRGTRDRANQWGYHYDWTPEKIAEVYTARRHHAFDVIAAGERAARKHLEPRWWRPHWQPGKLRRGLWGRL
jgi:Glycosyl transferase family 2